MNSNSGSGGYIAANQQYLQQQQSLQQKKFIPQFFNHQQNLSLSNNNVSGGQASKSFNAQNFKRFSKSIDQTKQKVNQSNKEVDTKKLQSKNFYTTYSTGTKNTGGGQGGSGGKINQTHEKGSIDKNSSGNNKSNRIASF